MKSSSTATRIGGLLLTLMILYGVASLMHFSHNAIYLERYPNMPAWITRSGVMGAWLSIASIGVLGYGLWRWGFRLAGLAIIGVYAVMGFDALAHYCLAPISAHTFGMNLTIGGEVVAAAALLGAVMYQMRAHLRAATSPESSRGYR
jgi:hypothetical protein